MSTDGTELDPLEQRLIDIGNSMVEFSQVTTEKILEQWNLFARLDDPNPTQQRIQQFLADRLSERIRVIGDRLREDPALIPAVENVLLAILKHQQQAAAK